MALSIVKTAQGNAFSAEAFDKCRSFNQRPETAAYFAAAVKKKIENLGLSDSDEGKQLIKISDDFAKNVKTQSDWDNAWTGVYRVMTDFLKLQSNLADKAQEHLQQSVGGELRMEYAISDEGDFLRGYAAATGQALDQQTEDQSDVLFNAWLATHELFSKNGKVYLSTDKGTLLTEPKTNNPIEAKGKDLKSLFQDEKKGFQAFLAEKNITITIKDRSEEQFAKKKIEKAQPKIDQPSSVNAGPSAAAEPGKKPSSDEPGVEPETPSSGGGAR